MRRGPSGCVGGKKNRERKTSEDDGYGARSAAVAGRFCCARLDATHSRMLPDVVNLFAAHGTSLRVHAGCERRRSGVVGTTRHRVGKHGAHEGHVSRITSGHMNQ